MSKDIYDVTIIGAGPAGLFTALYGGMRQAQLKIFESTIVLNQSIEKVEKDSDNLFELTSHTGEVHYSRTIIITAGNGAFEPRRLNINTSEDFENVNLHYYVDDMNRYADEHVMLLGGGDSAV